MSPSVRPAASQRPGDRSAEGAQMSLLTKFRQQRDKRKRREGTPKQEQRGDRKNREGIKLMVQSSGHGRFNSYLLAGQKVHSGFPMLWKNPNELSG